MRLYIVRHGATDWNQAHKIQGAVDIPLNEQGCRQAQNIAHRLADIPLQRIFSSPLSRAYQTAQAIAAPHGLCVEEESALSELGFGRWEGDNFRHIAQTEPDLYHTFRHHPEQMVMPGGQSLAQRLAQSVQFVQQTLWPLEYTCEHVAIVSHAYGIRLLMAALFDAPLTLTTRFFFPNTSLTIVKLEANQASLWLLGDDHHNDQQANGGAHIE